MRVWFVVVVAGEDGSSPRKRTLELHKEMDKKEGRHPNRKDRA